jgi:hypothetical protein
MASPPPPLCLNVTELTKISTTFDVRDSNRWIRLVTESLIDLRFTDIPPHIFIKALDHLISPTIADNVQLDVRVECIFDNSATASTANVDYIKEVFKKKYPPRFRLNKTNASTLLAYYERALTILYLFDGRDLTEATDNTPLTSTNKFLLSTVVKSFAKGIYNKNIQAKAIDSGALTSAGLYTSFLIVKEAKEKIEIGKMIVKEEDIEEMIRLLQQNKS